MSKLKLLLDVDEVVCFSGFLELVNEFLNTNYTIDDFTSYYIDEVAIPKERMNEFNEFISNRNQYENPVFLPGAIEAIKRLSNIYEIYFCSDCRNPFDLKNSGRIFKGKFELLYKTFDQDIIPAKNYILTGVKKIFNVDVQVDDLLHNLNPDIDCKILFPSYHNKDISDDTLLQLGVIRAGNDWKDGWDNLEQILIMYAKNNKPSVLIKK